MYLLHARKVEDLLLLNGFDRLRADLKPIEPQGVPADNMSAIPQGKTFRGFTEQASETLIHLIFGNPQRQLGGFSGEVGQFNPLKIRKFYTAPVPPSRLSPANSVK